MEGKPADERLRFGAQYYESFKEEKEERAEQTLLDLEAKRYYDELDEDVPDEALDDLLEEMLGPVRYEDNAE